MHLGLLGDKKTNKNTRRFLKILHFGKRRALLMNILYDGLKPN